ncbi:MAG: hypothetical protein RQ731_08135 [Anaerosomatales bacterium]|nr:hypothetical protein [Anaerosomatales bacterium]
MGVYTTDGKDTGVTAIKNAATHAALYNTAGSELTGGTPAYARKAITWGTVASGAVALTGTPVSFDVPAGADVKTIRYCDAAGTTIYGMETLATAESYASQGVFELTAGSMTITD